MVQSKRGSYIKLFWINYYAFPLPSFQIHFTYLLSFCYAKYKVKFVINRATQYNQISNIYLYIYINLGDNFFFCKSENEV